MQWSLRLRAAERGIWKSAELRRMLADAGLEISAGKMSSWWAGTPPTMRLEELDVLCAVLEGATGTAMTTRTAAGTARWSVRGSASRVRPRRCRPRRARRVRTGQELHAGTRT